MSNYKFGLVCISTDMQDAGFRFQTMTRKRFNEIVAMAGRNDAVDTLRDRILNNLLVTEKIIRHCAKRDIAAYRLSSALFPLVTDTTLGLTHLVSDFEIITALAKIKQAVLETGVRISTHPDQWNSLASENPATINQTIRELNFHGGLLDQCGATRSAWNPINIHVGLSGKDPAVLKDIRAHFIENFEKLEPSVKSRLTIENDDKGLWTCENILLHFEHRFPLCFDEHHDLVNPSTKVSHHDAYQLFIASWVMRSHAQMPLFHYSESIPGEKNIRAHADFATRLPMSPTILDNEEIYWDVELKGKDRAIYKLQQMDMLVNGLPEPHVDID